MIVVDNDSADGTADAVRALAPKASFIQTGRNAGFAAACNVGATQATRGPSRHPQPRRGSAAGLWRSDRRPWVEDRRWSAWQALVAEGEGTRINSAGNPVHFTGIAWAGRHGNPIAAAPPAGEVASLSGACLAISRFTWEERGGPPKSSSSTTRTSTSRCACACVAERWESSRGAIVDHDYEFGGDGGQKWRWLERNRWASLIRTYPTRLLILVGPALLATELALIPASIAGGWGRQKLLANLDVVRRLPRLLSERRQIQATRSASAADFAAWLTPDLDSPFIAGPARSAPARLALRTYWRVVKLLIGPRSVAGSAGSGSR